MTHFRQIFDQETLAFTYLLGDDSGAAILIDAGSERTTLPVLAILAELNLRLDYLLQTHLHDDEPNDAAALKERTGARVVASEAFMASADIPVHRQLAVRLGYAAARESGFRTNEYLERDDTNGRDETMARLKARWAGPGGFDTAKSPRRTCSISN